MAARRRHSSPFSHQRKQQPSSPYSFCSSTSAFSNSRSVTKTSGTVSVGGPRSVTSKGRGESMPVVGETVGVARVADNIKVTIRLRPLSEKESQRGDEVAWYADGDQILRNAFNSSTMYAFDKVFGPSTVSQEVYEVAARPVVKSAMEGVNGTVFAYGVTSSGKTHTMHGDQYSPGIIPLAIKDVFSMIQDTPGREFLLRVSYLEIYNEIINDLLDPTGQNLRVREDAQGTYVEGMKEEVVLSPGHALSFIASGEAHRHVGSTNFNLLSSRSHTIFTLMIESSAHGDEYDGVVFSQLNLIDLAGSESSKAETTGLRRKEGSYINKSLLTLGTVIGKLSEGKASHIPYRDSKLTRLLQSSLSGQGYVSLISTVTPASSHTEETHNTLKFANRAKHIEINASSNKLIDEKSLIKKYQKEISTLRHELELLRNGMIAGINPEELFQLKQQFEEGQVKMQSRLEEEEDAKAALMSRIQRLTKLILVSSKNTTPMSLNDGESDKHSSSSEGPFLHGKKYSDDSSFNRLEVPSDLSHKSSPRIECDETSPSISLIAESTKEMEVTNASTTHADDMTLSDQLDLFVEQAKMLAGEIALGESTLKRLLEQSVDNPNSSNTQLWSVEREIEEKKAQLCVLEQRIAKGGAAQVVKASCSDMHQTIERLMTQCSEKSFELEIKSADNRILQEQLQKKNSECEAMVEKANILEQQLASFKDDFTGFEELKKKFQIQQYENDKLRTKLVKLVEENTDLRIQNQRVAEEASYAKKLASAAAVELKNLANEVTELSIEKEKIEKVMLASNERVHRSSHAHHANGFNRKYSDPILGRKSLLSSPDSETVEYVSGDFELDQEQPWMGLQAKSPKKTAHEAELAEKRIFDENMDVLERATQWEQSLENDLANMQISVAELDKQGTNHGTVDGRYTAVGESAANVLIHDMVDSLPSSELNEDSSVVRPKAHMHEVNEKRLTTLANTGANSHVC